MYYILLTIFIISCFVLIIFVLLQPSKSDASGVFGGGGASSTAFGPRGTQTVLAKITIGAAIVFFIIAFLFSVPGLFTRQSVGDSVAPEAPAAVEPAPATPEQPATTGQPEQTPPSTNAAAPAENKDAKAGEKKAGDKKAATPAKPDDKEKK